MKGKRARESRSRHSVKEARAWYGVLSELLAGSAALAILLAACGGGPNDSASLLSPRSPVGELLGVACPSPEVCYVSGAVSAPTPTVGQGEFSPNAYNSPPGVVLKSVDGGRRWARQRLPKIAGPLSDIACWSITHCIAVGQIAYGKGPGGIGPGALVVGTANGGHTWRPLARPTGVRGLAQLSCPGATCVAVGATSSSETIIVSHDRGRHWDRLSGAYERHLHLSSSPMLGSLTCVSDNLCYLADFDNSALIIGKDDAQSWSVLGLPKYLGPNSVECQSSQSCFVSSTDLRPPAHIGPSHDVVLPMVGDHIEFQHHHIVKGVTRVGVCVTRGRCMIVGSWHGAGQFLSVATIDAGATWYVTKSRQRGYPLGIACPSPSRCLAVGTFGPNNLKSVLYETNDFGRHWLRRVFIS